jgi:putative ABC transport system permease protein
MGTLFQDLRFALRQLGRAPGFAITAVLTLALGIGANTAIFSLVNSLLLKPLPVENPGQVAELAEALGNGPMFPAFSLPEFKQIRAEAGHSFSGIAAATMGLDGISMPGQQPQRILTTYVSGNFFDLLGLKPSTGRLLLSSEGEVVGQDPVIVLSYDYWKEKFNADPAVVGHPVTVDGRPFTIVGVAPKDFHGVQAFANIEAYLPISELSIESAQVEALTNWQNREFTLYARLQPEASFKQASAGMAVIARDLIRLQPVAEKGLALAAFPEPTMRIPTGNGSTIFVMAGLFLSLAIMVLLLACVNVANLVLVRATAREREMAIRSAMGAKRSRLMRQMITESVLLALIGGLAGVVLGMWASNGLAYINPHADLPLNLRFGFDWRIFFYSFATALLAGVVVGLAPAMRMAKANVSGVLRESGRGVSGGRHWFRDTLVALQIAASLVLLRSLTAMQSMDFGFKPDGVLNLVFDPSEIGMTDQQARDLSTSILARVRQLAGVQAASHASTVPLGYFGNGGDLVTIDGAPPPADPSALGVGYNVVSPDYFTVMGIDVLAGRSLAEQDDAHGREVAVISQTMARKFWPNQNAIGRTFHMTTVKDSKIEVVGIARDAEFQVSSGGKTQPYLYLPYAQHIVGNSLMVLQLRTAHDPMALAPMAQKAIHDLAPGLPIFQVQTMRQGLYTLNGLLLFQIGASLAAIMGALGLTLAVIGLYGVVSYAVSRRVHEIGLRMALGASRSTVFRMIYKQSFLMITGGLAVGLALALAVARAVGSFVVVNVFDPTTYIGVALVLAFAALGSCYFPARRAMSVEPMVALRED